MSNNMNQEPREFACMDDSPFNNGWREIDEDLDYLPNADVESLENDAMDNSTALDLADNSI